MQLLEHMLVDRVRDVVFGRYVVIEVSRGNTTGSGYPAHGGRMAPILDKQLARGQQSVGVLFLSARRQKLSRRLLPLLLPSPTVVRIKVFARIS